MSRLTRDGTAEPLSRDQILRRERGQGRKCSFFLFADDGHEQDWQPYPVDPSLAIYDEHIYIYIIIHSWSALSEEFGSTGIIIVDNPARGQLNKENVFFPCPRSFLRIYSSEIGSAVPSRVSPLVLHTLAESGAYSRDSSRFPRGCPFIPSTAAIGSAPPCLSGHHVFAYSMAFFTLQSQ